MDDEQSTDNPWPWAPPDTTPAESPVRASGFCVCAYCKQPGVCTDYTKFEGRYVHPGACYEKMTKGR